MKCGVIGVEMVHCRQLSLAGHHFVLGLRISCNVLFETIAFLPFLLSSLRGCSSYCRWGERTGNYVATRRLEVAATFAKPAFAG